MSTNSTHLRALLAGITLVCSGNLTGASAAPLAQEQGHGHEHERESEQEQEQKPVQGSQVASAGDHARGEDTAAEDHVRLRASLAHTAYTRSLPQQLTLKVDFHAEASITDETEVRPALNLALLIDRSGSMEDDRKFEQAMESVSLVIENLTERDILSVIAFSDSAVVLSPAGRVVNKAFLRHRLSEVAPQGWTNLSAGLLEAVAQIESHEPGNSANVSGPDQTRKKVIVLTDGKANRGVTDAADLEGLVETLRDREITLSTIGVGADFDGKLLATMAEAGGGRYSYVKSSEDIPAAMARELDGFLAVLAQNVEMSVRVGADAEIVRIYGRLLARPTREASFKLGDLRDGERGTFLFELAPRAFAKGSSVEVEVSLVGDFSVDATRHRQTVSLRALYTKNPTDVIASRNPAVTLYADVLAALEDTEEAVLAFDRERAEQAGALFDIIYETARAAALESRDQELLNQIFLLKHFMTELAAADQGGLLHSHDEAASRLGKEVEYRRYLLEHHRGRH